ncbi:aggregation-promoting factor [Lactobacillus jensenii]
MKNTKSIRLNSLFTKFMAVAAVTLTGVMATNLKSNTAHAATIVNNDTDVVTVNYVPGYGIAVWNNPDNPHFTGQRLAHGTSWKVIQTVYSSTGEKWYDLGLNQWVPAKYVVSGYNKSTSNNSVATVAQSSAQPQSTVSSNTQTQAVSANSSSSNAYNSASSAANTTSSYTATTTSTSSYTSTATGSEADAKAWIANKESSGSYTAQNGQYYGKYQLSISYLNGDLSASNQEKVADNYVYSRYGSWTAAKAFWLANGWY